MPAQENRPRDLETMGNDMTSRPLMIMAVAAGLCLTGAAAFAQTAFPTKQVTIVVPYPPGGTTDIYARMIGQALEKKLGQPFVIENKPGGATQVAASHVANAAADGHTLMMSTITTMSMNPLMFKNLAYDPASLIPVGLIARQSYALVAPPNSEHDTVEKIVAYAKEHPGELNYGTHGNGSSVHLVTELFSGIAGMDVVPIHYAGSTPALTATMAGEVDFYFDGITTSLPAIADGRVKGVAMTGKQRAEAAPDLPAMTETYPDMYAYTWYGIIAPKDTPREVVELLNREINAAIQTPEMLDRLKKDAVEPGNMTPEEFGAMIAADTEQWRGIVTDLNITLD